MIETYTIQIKEIIDETHDTKTFRMTRPEGFDFSPGEYCLVWLEDFSRSKPFTIASTPDKDHLDFTVKQIGEFTSALFRLKVGDSFRITSARKSKLSIKAPVSKHLIFIAGGSGITPFYPTLKSLAGKVALTLLYTNRTDKDIIFKKELERLEDAYEDVTVTFFSTKQEDSAYENRRISKEDLESVMSADAQWYVCGPPSMTKAIQETLLELGISKENVHKESWELPGKHENKEN